MFQPASYERISQGLMGMTGVGIYSRIRCTRYVHARFAEPDAPKFEDAIGKLRKRPEPALRMHPAVVLRKYKPL